MRIFSLILIIYRLFSKPWALLLVFLVPFSFMFPSIASSYNYTFINTYNELGTSLDQLHNFYIVISMKNVLNNEEKI